MIFVGFIRSPQINLLRGIKRKLKAKIGEIYTFNKKTENNILTVTHYPPKYFNCSWTLSKKDTNKLSGKKIFCLCLRLYDISNASSSKFDTCIMKEFHINKHTNNYNINLPLIDGTYCVQIGYRLPSGKWKLLAENIANLERRNSLKKYFDDSWFYLDPDIEYEPMTIHEKMHNISGSKTIGGSEQL